MQAGQKQFKPFLENVGGINLSDSPFYVGDGQATGGYNYDYSKKGGFSKSLCPGRINSSADAQLRTLGLFLRHTKANSKSIIRAAGTKIQVIDLYGTFTNLTEDTVSAGSDFLTSATAPVVGNMFTSTSADVLWLAGGGLASVYGVSSSTKVTKNGVPAPTGTISASVAAGSGAFTTTGTYRYSVAFRKSSTQAISNAVIETTAVVAATTNEVTIDVSAITNLDSTKYDKIYIYRSTVSGAALFTTGDLIAQLATTSTSYTDTGTSITSSTNIPRAGNSVLDNSVLGSGTFETMATFKRRLVTANESTIYFSDLNKPESWPTANFIEVPSGGKITGLGVISFTTPSATVTDEYLAVFKENELWVITGSSISDWSLKFIDSTGCINQPLVVNANGYLYFIDNRGAYLWDGAGKPVFITDQIDDLFGVNTTIDKAKFNLGFGVFFKPQNQVVWYLSDGNVGEQQYLLKLDLRLTLPSVSNTLGQRVLDGVFIQGKVANAAYAGAAFTFPTSSSQEDVLITGDAAGYVYRQFYSTTGVGANDYDFTYDTKFLDFGTPGINKRFEKLIVWAENTGDWELCVDYWTNFKNSSTNKNSVCVPINQNTDGTIALWDVGKWDEASWDGYNPAPKALVYNLQAQPYNNTEGESLKLRFRNQNTDEPVTIYGYAVLYTEIGYRN